MKHIFFILLSLLTLNSFSQSENGMYFNEKIVGEVYSRIDSTYHFECCTEAEKKSAYQISFCYQTETTCFDDYFNLDEYYYVIFNDEYLEYIGDDISKYYKKFFSEKKRKSFTKSCWSIDKKVLIDDNMTDGDGMVCATTHLKIIFYFQ